MFNRSRFIRGTFGEESHDIEIEAQPVDEANRLPSAVKDGELFPDILMETSPFNLAKNPNSALSPQAKDALAGREVCLEIPDDVSSINDSIHTSGTASESVRKAYFKSLFLKEAAKARSVEPSPEDEGSSADKPINLLIPRTKDVGNLGHGSTAAERLKNYLEKYQMVDLDKTVESIHSSDHCSDERSPGIFSAFKWNRAKEMSSDKESSQSLRTFPRWLKRSIICILLLFIISGVAVAVVLSKSKSGVFSSSTHNASFSDSDTPSLPSNVDTKGQGDIRSVFPPQDAKPTASPITPQRTESIFERATETPTLSPLKVPLPSSVPEPSQTPTQTHTLPPTLGPVLTPTQSPTTKSLLYPTSAPTTLPTQALSAVPVESSTNNLTENPTLTPTATSATGTPTTASPTLMPTTAFPTQSPTIDVVNKMVIYFTAGRLDTTAASVDPEILQSFPTRKGTSFLVHLGDWNNPENNCKEDSFVEASDFFADSSIPVYFVMGDNEYKYCESDATALQLWKESFVNYEIQHWGQPPWDVFRQAALDSEYSDFSENFLFTYASGVFMSINLLFDEQGEGSMDLQLRMAANLDWIDAAYNLFKRDAKTIFIFTHDAPNEITETFYFMLYSRLESFYNDVEFILIHHSETGSGRIENKYNNIKNLSVLGIPSIVWPPLQMTIEFRGKKPTINFNENWEATVDDEQSLN